jgi:lipopolysaccharide transport system permease protein
MGKSWDIQIEPNNQWFDLRIQEVWRYRDLLLMLVKRDFVTFYKQTILGPLWFLIQPLIMTLMYSFIFGSVAGLSSDGLPRILFYLSGVTAWNYFADCLNKTATTFRDNQHIFGKVYFPRIVTPLSIVLSNLIKFGIQFLLFLVVLGVQIMQGVDVVQNWTIALVPLLVIMMAGLGMGLGMIITSLTTKYRDLIFLLQFGIQLFMFATPVIYPISSIPAEHQQLMMLNPVSPIIETFRHAFLGTGAFSWGAILYSGICTVVFLLLGALIFNRTEKNFMDTV